MVEVVEVERPIHKVQVQVADERQEVVLGHKEDNTGWQKEALAYALGEHFSKYICRPTHIAQVQEQKTSL